MKKQGTYWSGTSGLVLPVPNKQAYPPEYKNKSRLTYYSSLFSSLEINSSFYKVPQAPTVSKWVTETEEPFTFTFKLWRDITHVKNLVFKPADVLHFISVINQAAAKKGCLLIQFPPSITVDFYSQVSDLLELVSDCGWPIAVEFRHSSWYIGEVYELADEHNASIVLHDMPKSQTETLNKKAPFVYQRFHGPAGDYRGGYPDEQLQEVAGKIRSWIKEGKDVFVYFNNTAGDAVKNLLMVNDLLK